jgi:TolA-binding protein
MGERYPRWTYVVIFALLVIVAVLSVRALRGKSIQTTAITPEKAAPDQKTAQQPTAQREVENDRRIEDLNNEIATLRKENDDNTARVRELQAQLADSSKALAAAQQKLKVAQRQAERPPAAPPREKNLASKTAPAPPPPQTQTAQAPPPPSPPPQPQRRVDEAGQYEVLRDTALLEKPSTSSREVALVQRGMTVNVVAAVGDWLEVRSKYGKPPGYIRRQDVAPKQAQGNNNRDRF